MTGITTAVKDHDGRPIQTVVLDVTPVLDTSAYTSGDVLFVPIEVTAAARYVGARVELHSIIVSDGDDQNCDIDLVFSNADITLGTINSAVSISDADAAKIIGYVTLGSAEMKDLINSRLYVLGNIGQTLQLGSATNSLWLSGICRSGTPTYTASGMKIKLGLLGV